MDNASGGDTEAGTSRAGRTPMDLVMADFRECWTTIRHSDNVAGQTLRFYATFEGALITVVAALIGVSPRLMGEATPASDPLSTYLPILGWILVFGGISGTALYANVLWVRRSFVTYVRTLNGIRNKLLQGSHLKELYRNEWLTTTRAHNMRVHFWRAVFLTLVNSSILSVGVWFSSGDASWMLKGEIAVGGLSPWPVIGVAAALVVHSLAYWLIIVKEG